MIILVFAVSYDFLKDVESEATKMNENQYPNLKYKDYNENTFQHSYTFLFGSPLSM